MTARELEQAMIEQFGPDFREKVIVGPLGSFPLADCFAECGLEDPRAAAPALPLVLLPMQPPPPARFPEHPATVEAQIRWGMEYIRQRYGAYRPWSGYASRRGYEHRQQPGREGRG